MIKTCVNAEHPFRLDLGVDTCYNMRMKLIFTAAILASALSGCAVTTGMNVASYIATGKGTTDHATSLVTGADCDSVRVVTHGGWPCEQPRDPATTYNRNTY